MGAKFIVFEGIDGSGKGAQVAFLVQYLNDRNIPAWLTYEPTLKEPYGSRIRQILRGEELPPEQGKPMSAAALQSLYVDDRKGHVVEILEHLSRGEWVLCDRYWYSTVAYGVAEGLSFDEWIEKNRYFPVPDLAFYFDVPAEEAMRRIEKRELDKRYFEKLEKLKKVREVYLKLVERQKEFHLIDNTPPPDQVFKEVLKRVQPLL